MLDQIDLTKLIFGRLSWEAIPYHEPILIGTFAMVALGGLALFAVLTYYKQWGPLWRNWFTSIDHKRIGIMYMVLGIIMLLRGFADAIMMRAQQAMAFGDNPGFLPPHHFDQVFTAHGVSDFFAHLDFILGGVQLATLEAGARGADRRGLREGKAGSSWLPTGRCTLTT